MTESLLPVEDIASHPVAIVVILGMVLAGLLICGWSMKLACGFSGGREIGILRGLAASIASSLAATAAMALIVLLSPDSSPWVPGMYSLVAAVAVVAIVLVQNPIRALCTYLLYCIIGTAFSIAAAAVVAALLYCNLDEEQLKHLAASYTVNRQPADLPNVFIAEPPIAPVHEVRSQQPPAPITPEPAAAPAKKKLPPGVKANPFVK